MKRSAAASWKPLCLASLLAVTALERNASAQPTINPPSGYGRYCSFTRPVLGSPTWGFEWGNASSNPCSSCTTSCTVRQAGLWNPNGVNRVLAICQGGARYWIGDSGSTGLINMKNLLLAAGHTTCRVNVSPKELPVLSHPYNPFADYLNGVTPLWNTSQVAVGYGMDLAHAGTTYTYAQLGLFAGGSTNVLDHQRHYTSHLVVNGHAGYDWGVDTAAGRHNTMKVRASAAGRVISARYQPASEDCPGQGEVMIHHVVGTSLTTPYREEFWTYYAHMDDIVVAVGDDVVESQTLGEVGFTGCSSGPTSHIHFGVHRVRNVTDALMDTPPLVPNSEQTTGRRVIDPFGWNGPSIDPWAFYAPPGFGAASMYLWRTGYAPPDWAAH